MTLQDDVAAALAKVDPSAPSTTQLNPLARVLGEALGHPDATYAISVSQAGNLIKQADQSVRARRAKLLVVCVRDATMLPAIRRVVPKRVGPGRLEAAIVVVLGSRPRLAALLEPRDGVLRDRLGTQLPGVDWFEIEPGWHDDTTEEAVAAVPLPGLSDAADDTPLILDPAIKRMLRLAIASYKAVMLVGPPGTGKTTLLEEAVREASRAPSSYGLAGPPRGLMVVTPEESWTTRELLGGETVDDDGRLRFTPGHVLRAITHDRWLVLDEANRADLDRIFGALLTWLSEKEVTVSAASGGTNAASVELGWNDAPTSRTVGIERLETGTGEPIRFLAGTDWRLLGTYNAVDAQRVFHLGQALGRRFTRVPVPPVDRKQFLQALQPRLEQLPMGLTVEPLENALAGLYAAHLDLHPPMGPATFLAVPAYIARGLAVDDAPGEVPEDSEHLGADTGESTTSVATVPGPASRASEDWITARAHDLLAEGYLLGAGTALAGLDDLELETFRARVVDREGLLAPQQWAFIAELLPALA